MLRCGAFFPEYVRASGSYFERGLEASGPIKISEVEEAQKEIVKTAKRLSDEVS